MKVELIKWTEENKEDLVRICNAANRQYLSGRLPKPYTLESADWWYKNAVCADGKIGLFRAISADGRIVGNVTIEGKEDYACKDCELGYLLDPEYEGRGIMTEAARQICGLAFETLDIERITSCVYSPNIASQKVLLKIGFIQEGIMKRAVYKDGNIWDLHIYGMYR